MNDDLTSRLEGLLGPLRVEYNTGCRNHAAVGGFDQRMQHEVRACLRLAAPDHPARVHLERLQVIFEAYRRMSTAERQARLREVKRRLDALLGNRPMPAPPAHQAPDPPLEPSRSTASLEPVFPPEREPEPAPRPVLPSRRSVAPEPGPGDLDSPIQFLRGVGPQRARQLANLGIETIGDLLFHFPRRHEDRSQLAPIASARVGERATFQGRVRYVDVINPRRGGLKLVKAIVSDGTASLDLVWFNQPWVADQLDLGMGLIFSGRVSLDKRGRHQLTMPAWEPLEVDSDPIHTGRLVPIYRLTEGIPQTTMRRWCKTVVDGYAGRLPEVLPRAQLEAAGLVGRPEAVRSYHFPASEEDRLLARRRLVFEEFFGLQVALAQRRYQYDHRGEGIAFDIKSALSARLHHSLPFEMTDAQVRVITEIARDMAEPRPMNRLLQGDVGSGKTLVALTAMLIAVDNGYQAAVMVPTEILAEQHHRVIRHWCEPLGVAAELVTGRAGSKQRRESQGRLADGSAQIAVGTHALIQEGIDFDQLGLVVIDEQHRFGVMQRKLLSGKGVTPDVLVMTATPIPRTLALTVYGELDVSVIDEMPAGRVPIITTWHPLGERRQVYREIKQRLDAGRQAYAVCPLVEESEALAEVEAVTGLVEHLQEHFKKYRVAMIHGRLKPAEKDEVMLAFRAGEVDILAATTVIEVGIDVPNATEMLIVNADRFGLAQLHQLRGRVGRGAHESHCYLLTDAKYDPQFVDEESGLQYRDARARMRVICEHLDGFKLAEADLELRGPGELGGTRQSGSMDFHVASLAYDGRILEEAREYAKALVAQDPYLAEPRHAELARFVSERFRDRGQLAEVG